MPLVIIERGRLSVPAIICDHCGKEIKTAADGNYHWRPRTSKQGERSAVFFTHKACCHAFDRSHPSGGADAMGLDDLLAFLANNLSWDSASAMVRAMVRSQL
jgi:hypothetical protein